MTKVYMGFDLKYNSST